jgi:hypothetical protein
MKESYREELGKIVRKVWVKYCKEIGDNKPNHIASWEEISEIDKEADRRIGETLIKLFSKKVIKRLYNIVDRIVEEEDNIGDLTEYIEELENL